MAVSLLVRTPLALAIGSQSAWDLFVGRAWSFEREDLPQTFHSGGPGTHSAAGNKGIKGPKGLRESEGSLARGHAG